VLKLIVEFAHSVDCGGRHETPAGKAGLGRPRRRLAPRRLPDRPRKAKCLELQSTGLFNTANLYRGGINLEASLKIGDPAPDFSLPATTKEKLTLSYFKGKKNVVVAFYGMDFTPG
jgi:AhpC/TSA family